MTLKVSAHIRDIPVYEPGKPVEELERELGLTGTVKLASNENSVGPSPEAVKALSRRISGINRYPDGGGYFLKQKISEFHGVGSKNIILGNGSNEILEIAARTFLSPGDRSIMSDHSFVVYGMVTLASGAVPFKVPLCDFFHDLDGMAKAVDNKTRIIFIANPDNPTGTSHGMAGIEDFLSRIPESLLVVLDEAYSGYEERKDIPDPVRLLKRHQNLLVLRTFSKIYGLAGLRIGYGLASEELIGGMNRLRQPFNTNLLAQAAATAALGDTEHLKRSFESNRKQRRFLEGVFRKMGISFVPSETNFILLNVKNGREVYNLLLQEGVIVRPMDGYGFGDYIRVTIGTEEENEIFVLKLGKVLKGREGQF